MNRKKLLVILFTLFSLTVFSQPGNPSAAPIGGVAYLLMAGLVFGVFNLRNKRRQ